MKCTLIVKLIFQLNSYICLVSHWKGKFPRVSKKEVNILVKVVEILKRYLKNSGKRKSNSNMHFHIHVTW
jgi:hypothetical protein